MYKPSAYTSLRKSLPYKSFRLEIKRSLKNILDEVSTEDDRSIYYTHGDIAKRMYKYNSFNVNIVPSKQATEALHMSKLQLNEALSMQFKYKKEEKLHQAKSLLKIAFLLAKDLSGKRIENDCRNIAYCYFTETSLELLKIRYDVSMSKSSMYRMIDAFVKAGFITPNTYVDENQNVRKNYRFDPVNPSASYSTSYLLNLKAIFCLLDEDLAHDEKEMEKNKELYKHIRSIARSQSEYEPAVQITESRRKILEEVYNFDSKELVCKSKRIIIDQKMHIALFNAIVYAIEDIRKSLPKNVLLKDSKAYESIWLIANDSSISEEDRAQKILRNVFKKETNGVSEIALKMIEEYNAKVDDVGKKRMRLRVAPYGISTRIWSATCRTSRRDSTRKAFVDSHLISWSEDVHSMIPNLSRFLESGDEFRQDDLYAKMCSKIESNINLTVTRDEMKQYFLRAKFTKSAKKFVANMKMSYAEEASLDANDKSYRYVKVVRTSERKKLMTLSKEWDSTETGSKKTSIWNEVYNAVHDICGKSSSPKVFFWESLLELIICLDCSRKGNLCYNIYDEFFCEQPIDLNKHLQAAAKIVYEAYKGNIKPLEEFANAAA